MYGCNLYLFSTLLIERLAKQWASMYELRGAPMMKSEQRATRDETRDLAMPRQGVSLLNVMLDHGGTPHKTHTRPKKPEDNAPAG